MGKTITKTRQRRGYDDSSRALTEYEEQVLYFQWIDTQPRISPYVFHIPNGSNKSSIMAGVRLKRSGVRAGIPDIFVAIPRGEYHGLWIEMKSMNGKLSEAQEGYLKRFNAIGYMGQACYGFEAAKALTEAYLRL